MTLLPPQGEPRPALLNDTILDGTAVRTGPRARGELVFMNETRVRLGANTIFSFKEGARSMELRGGAMLLDVPEGAAKIITGPITSTVTGTVMLRHGRDQLKFIVLHGIARLSLEGSERGSLVLRSGQCTVSRFRPQPAELGERTEIDLNRLMETSLLIKRFSPLSSEGLIEMDAQRQSQEKSRGQLIEVAIAANTIDAIDQAAAANTRGDVLPPVMSTPPTGLPSATPTPSPTPSVKRSSMRSPTSNPSPGKVTIPPKPTVSGPDMRGTLKPTAHSIDRLPLGHGP